MVIGMFIIINKIFSLILIIAIIIVKIRLYARKLGL